MTKGVKDKKVYLTLPKLLELISSPPVDRKWNDQIVHTQPFLEMMARGGCPCCHCKNNEDCEVLAQVMLTQYDANTRAMVWSCGMGDWYSPNDSTFEVVIEAE